MLSSLSSTIMTVLGIPPPSRLLPPQKATDSYGQSPGPWPWFPQSSLDLLRKRKQMPDSRRVSLASEVAEVLAVQALGFIAEDEERLGRFLALTGMGPAEIRTAARDRHFLAGVLDYLCGDEDLL